MPRFESVPDLPPETLAAFDTIKGSVVPSTKTDGWTGVRQRRFLEAIADGETVRDACGLVRLSPASAYAFRRRASGRAFDLGWKAADLLARERVAADLLIRAVEGQEAETTRPDGSVLVRRYKDNRLALQMLNRLDRYADASERTAPGHAARLVAGEFEEYLNVVEADGGPARAGLFMLAREQGVDGEGELEPLLALARADRLIRCGTATGEVAVADLDPAKRAEWTADQWVRAEAAGLVALAPAGPAGDDEPPFTHQPCSTSDGAEGDGDDDEDETDPVWWCELRLCWRTSFPPDDDFAGEESGEPGQKDYERDLSARELALMDAPYHAECADRAERGHEERDRWFATLARDCRDAGIPIVEEDWADLLEIGPDPDLAPATNSGGECILPDSQAFDADQDTGRSVPMSDTTGDITILNSLIKTVNDSITGYQESAKDIGNQRLASLFQDRAMERQQVVTKLQAEVGRLGGDPASSGSLLGGAHQIFLDMKSAVTGKDDDAILAEVRRGEEYLRDKFDTALAEANLGASTRQVIQEAAQSVRSGADQVAQFQTGGATTTTSY